MSLSNEGGLGGLAVDPQSGEVSYLEPILDERGNGVLRQVAGASMMGEVDQLENQVSVERATRMR